MDGAYQSKYLAVARMLWDASKRDPSSIPDSYCEHLSYQYSDGSVSLVPLLNRFEAERDLEDYEFDEAIELLGRVNPEDWPFIEEIESVDVEELLKLYEEDTTPPLDFVEDNLGASDATQKILKRTLESVFGGTVSEIRDPSGHYPGPLNNFLQEEDGTFSGTFMHEGYKFDFEIAPTESGWLCTYRMNATSLGKVPPVHKKSKKKHSESRRVRARGW